MAKFHCEQSLNGINCDGHGWSHLQSSLSPRQTWQDTKGMSWIDYSNFYSLLRFPSTHLQCQQSNEPLPSNEGCRPPSNAVEGLLAGTGGHGNARGDPCCGRPVRYMMVAFPFTTVANPCSFPSTWTKPNDNQQAQHWCEYIRKMHFDPG